MKLSAKQKAVICQIARRAFDKLAAAAQIAGVDFDTWRREEVERCTGKPGLRACVNDDYSRLAAHFESLAGEDDRALNHLIREQGNTRRQIEHGIVSTLEEAGLPLSYAITIRRDRFKAGLDDITDEQLRHVLITVKARVSKRRKTITTREDH